MSRIGLKLKELRERTGLSVRAFADEAKMNFGTYANWENRSKKPFLSMDMVSKFMPVYLAHGIERSEVLRLVGLEEEPHFQELSNASQDVIRFEEIQISRQLSAEVEDPIKYRESGRPAIDILVVGEIESLGPQLYVVGVVGDQIVAYPSDFKGNLGTPLPFDPHADWDNGEVLVDKNKHTFRILGVVRSLNVECNGSPIQ